MLRRNLSTLLHRGPPPLPAGTLRLVPAHPSWDPRSTFGADLPVTVSDADMARFERLSLLEFPRKTVADEAEFLHIRAGVSAVLTAARALNDVNGNSGNSGSSGGEKNRRTAQFDVAIAALSEEQLEQIAEAQWSALRNDEVTEGSEVESPLLSKSITAHAARTDLEGNYFIAPKGNSEAGV